MINKLPPYFKIPANNILELTKQLHNVFVDSNKKINEIVNLHNTNYPDTIMFRINGTDLECSLDGGTTWKIVTLT